MQRTCAQCDAVIVELPGETALRNKIGGLLETGSLPNPTLCADCRMQRRMAWRNERMLYRRTCDASGKSIISVYGACAPFPVFERGEWWSDTWDALSYGRSFDFSRTFFDQFTELQKVVPRSALNGQNTENCDYCNFAFDTRNCYLSHCAYRSESLLYCYWSLECKDSVDCSYIFQCEQCLRCTDCNHTYGSHDCTLSHNCSDCAYLYDCRGCSNCFCCTGLRQKSYCMFNDQLTKEEYQARLRQFDLQNPEHIASVEKRLAEMMLQHPRLFSIQDKSEDCTGDYVFESKHCLDCYQTFRSRDYIHGCDTDEMKDSLDCYHAGWSEVIYESYSPVRQRNSAFTAQCWDGSDNFYSDNCMNCSHCFGCIGLRQKKFCILNRQYTEDAYRSLLQKIVDHMRKLGEYGEFFPVTLSPFAYNVTLAQEHYPLSEDDARKRGWRWTEDLPFTKGKETVGWDQIPERIEDIPTSILSQVLACESCSKNYRIIQQELEFYRLKKLPLPRTCPDCRHAKRIALRNSRKLYERSCDSCGKDFETTYAPDRKEKMYCEYCYLKAVY